jgi:hypothetical protein
MPWDLQDKCAYILIPIVGHVDIVRPCKFTHIITNKSIYDAIKKRNKHVVHIFRELFRTRMRSTLFSWGKTPIFCTCPSRSTMHIKYGKITIFGFSFHITYLRPCCRFPITTVTKEIPRRRITVTSSWKEISMDGIRKVAVRTPSL